MIIGQAEIPKFPLLRGDISNIRYPCACELKIDGEANIYRNGYLISKSSGKTRTKFHITDYLSQIIPLDTTLYGELHFEMGKAGDLYKFLSHAKDDNLNYTIFDASNNILDKLTYLARRAWLLSRVPKLAVQSWTAHNRQDVDNIFRKVVDMKYEGIVLKNEDSKLTLGNSSWVKMKMKDIVEVEVKAVDPVLERMDIEYNGRLVGCKLCNRYKSKVKVGDIVKIEHQGVLIEGGLRHPQYKGGNV